MAVRHVIDRYMADSSHLIFNEFKSKKHRRYPKKVFFTQREMRRFRLEEQLYQYGRDNPAGIHHFLAGEIICGPGASGIPSHRKCHQ